jgi:hypothetical protein
LFYWLRDKKSNQRELPGKSKDSAKLVIVGDRAVVVSSRYGIIPENCCRNKNFI